MAGRWLLPIYIFLHFNNLNSSRQKPETQTQRVVAKQRHFDLRKSHRCSYIITFSFHKTSNADKSIPSLYIHTIAYRKLTIDCSYFLTSLSTNLFYERHLKSEIDTDTYSVQAEPSQAVG
jgi:hypothetical protein